MNELSLFSGAGGGVLASVLLGWRVIGYVEKNEYCRKVLHWRIGEGYLDEAPIFTDVDFFLESGAAREYRGFVDVVTAGFPCQPFSLAGKRRGKRDGRNLWPQTIECIREVEPRFVFLENVRGILSDGYFGQILSDLAGCGYGIRWKVLSGAELGAPHKRDRIWVVAHAPGERLEGTRGEGDFTKTSWWEVEPEVGRVADGMAYRMDRIKALGNGEIPIVAARAWEILTEGL